MNRLNEREVSFSGYNVPIPAPAAVNPSVHKQKEKGRAWLRNRLLDLNFIGMTTTNNKPSGFFVNYTTITVVIAIVMSLGTLIGGLYKYTYDVAYQKGVTDTKQTQLQQEIEALKLKQAETEQRLPQATPEPTVAKTKK